jgi:hypothetical protein
MHRIIAIKISSGTHQKTDGLISVCKKKGYEIFREIDGSGEKDTSRMLAAGAETVYYILLANDKSLKEAYNQLNFYLPEGRAIVCESPSLVRIVRPGVFVIMVNSESANPKDISEFKKFTHTELTLKDIDKMSSLPFVFRDGSWYSLQDI